MCVATKASKKRRIVQNEDGSESTRSAGCPKNSQALVSKVTQTIFNLHMQNSAHTSRHYGDLTQLTFHECKMVKTNNERICVYCSETCISRCTACPGMSYIHFNPNRGPRKHYKFFYHCHSNAHFGLGRNDQLLLGKTRSSWKPPTDLHVRSNRKNIKKLLDEYNNK